MDTEQATVPYGYCHCGCGEQTPLATKTRRARGIIAGQPTDYVRGHNRNAKPTLKEAPLCACGCGGELPIRIASQQPRFLKNHDKRGTDASYEVVDAGFETPCWFWLGTINADGYGHVNTVEHRGGAHVMMYKRRFGKVPAKRELHHRCENRPCVNWDHLRPVTRAEHRRLRRDNKLDYEAAAAIRALAAQGVPGREIARRFGIGHTTARSVITGKTWA